MSIEKYSVSQVANTAAHALADNGKIVIGFWHNWVATSGQGYKGGRFTEMPLTDIPVQYNVVAVAFMKVDGGSSDPIPDFKPYKYSDAEFRRQIDVLHSQGRKVLISLGGADAHVELQSHQENAFVERIIELTDRYAFDGLDIDLEQSAITAAQNRQVIPAALIRVKEHYRQQGKNFIISMAPEFPYLTATGAYIPYITALEGYYDFIAPQFYNQGGDGVYVENIGWLAQNNDAQKADFLYYLTESLTTGTRGFTRIPHDKFVIGLPTNNDAAATGYVINPQDVFTALDRLSAAGLPIKGLMTWSVNWDAGFDRDGRPYSWEFINRYGSLVEGGTPPQQPAAPTNLASSAQTQNSIALQWTHSATPVPAVRFMIYRDGQPVNSTTATQFTDTNLPSDSAFEYAVSAVDAANNESARSAAIVVRTLADSGEENAFVSPPGNLREVGVTATSATVMWTASTSTYALKGYRVYRDGHYIGEVTPSQLTYTDAGLSAATAYRYRVIAEDIKGKLSEPSNTLSVTTQSGNEPGDYPQWTLRATYQAGDIVSHNGKNWVCLQTHTAYVEGWAPGASDSATLWREVK
ncbi:chitinase [Enterobacteriaceae bacterium 4M9]|nr:chitinase [Enterobacteriaceae bacterium 4M9]